MTGISRMPSISASHAARAPRRRCATCSDNFFPIRRSHRPQKLAFATSRRQFSRGSNPDRITMSRPQTLAEVAQIARSQAADFAMALKEFMDEFYLDHPDKSSQQPRLDAIPDP